MAVEKKTIPELPGVDGSLVSLEHFSVNVGVEWNDDLQKFWFEVNCKKIIWDILSAILNY